MIDANARAKIQSCLAPFAGQRLGIAVSGGGDSIALVRLLLEMRPAQEICVATVDHGLRPEANAEAEFVANLCAQHDLPHETLRWTGWQGVGNLMDTARRARMNLLHAWARRQMCSVICLGHTLEDQAETFLLRLARGSGVDGLSSMKSVRNFNGLTLCRPLLDLSRADLRLYLQSIGQKWIEDPSNENDRFDRIKFRKAAPALADLGLDAARLAATAQIMQRTRAFLATETQKLAKTCSRPSPIGTVSINRILFSKADPELQFRLLAHTLRWVAGAEHRPRQTALDLAIQAVSCGTGHTLAGCRLVPSKDDHVEIVKEPSRITPRPAENGAFSDVWHIGNLPEHGGMTLRCLGQDGLAQRPNWRNAGFSRAALVSSPSLWYGAELKSSAFLDKQAVWTCTHLPGPAGYFATIGAH